MWLRWQMQGELALPEGNERKARSGKPRTARNCENTGERGRLQARPRLRKACLDWTEWLLESRVHIGKECCLRTLKVVFVETACNSGNQTS